MQIPDARGPLTELLRERLIDPDGELPAIAELDVSRIEQAMLALL